MRVLVVNLKAFVRQLRKNPTFTALVLLMLTIGAGADALMFSVAYSVLLRPLPYRNGSQLVQLDSRTATGETGSVSWLNYQDWKNQSQSFSDLVSYIVQNSSLQSGSHESIRVVAVNSTANLLGMLGVKPALGRTFLPDEDQPEKPCVLILSDALWVNEFSSDPGVVGTSVHLDALPCTIVGVMPKGFAFPDGNQNGIWMPLHPQITSRGTGYLSVLGRLKPGVSLSHAQSELNIIAKRLSDAYPAENKELGIKATPYHDVVTGNVSTALWALIGAVLLVQLIICANVANMQLARAVGRKKEIAIRLAMGASRWKIAKQLLAESFVLAIIGAGIGLGVAHETLHLLKKVASHVLPRVNEIQLYPAVSLALLATAALTAVLFGLVPVVQTTNPDLESTLRENGRGVSGGRGRAWILDSLVVGQLVFAVVLLFGSVLLLHSLYRLLQQDVGFSPEHTITMRTSITGDSYNGRNLATSLFLPQVDRVRGLPGVQSAGLVTFLPLSLGHTTANFMIVGRPDTDPENAPKASLNSASEDYFRSLGIPLIRGRFFTENDGPSSQRVAIINDSLAKKYFGNEDPIGRQISFRDPDYIAHPLNIVGVVHGSRQQTLSEPAQPEIYFCVRQVPPNSLWTQILLRNVMTYVIRANGSAESLLPEIRKAIYSVDSNETLFDVQTMDAVVSRFVQDRRLGLILLSVFAVLALLVAAAGLYAMLSYSVEQRQTEIAVRMAMGAQRRDVLRLIVGRAFWLNMIGLGAGIVVAIAAGRIVSNILYGVQTWDPVTLTATVATLFVITLPAALIPAFRAASVNVLQALRTE